MMFEYTGSGLKGIFLKNGYRIVETPYGSGVSIENLEGLHRAIAVDIVRQKKPMTGAQFRFLRKEQDLIQEELAALFRVTAQTIAIWEKKGEEPVPGTSDISMRAWYSAYIHVNFGMFTVQPDPKHEDSVFQFEKENWSESEAA